MRGRLFIRLFVLGGVMAAGVSAMAESREVTLSNNGVAADVAVSVIDSKLATPENESTILTSLLLNSDLRGSVEDAAWYFPDSLTRKHRLAMDGLMLTQGWSRYDVPAAIDGKYQEAESELEVGPSIGGVVKSRWMGKPMKNATVLALAPTLAYAGTAFTDENGEFVFTDRDFPEGTRFVFQALNDKGENESNFDIIPQTYPSVTPLESAYVTTDKEEVLDETESADFDWRISHSGAIMLGEVMVVQKKLSDYDNPMELMARGEVDYQKIEKEGIRTVEDILRTIPGIIVVDHRAYYQTREVEFWVDNIPWESSVSPMGDVGGSTGGIIANVQMNSMGSTTQSGSQSDFSSNNSYDNNLVDKTYTLPYAPSGTGKFGGTLNSSISTPTPGIVETALGKIDQVLPADFIKKVQFFPPSAAMLLSPGPTVRPKSSGGIVIITTKDGTEKVSRPDWRMRYATPLGYQRRKEFYTPKYELMAEYDLNNRPTLYWIPRVNIGSDGNLTMPIPASVDNCTLIAEGIDADGHPVRITKSM